MFAFGSGGEIVACDGLGVELVIPQSRRFGERIDAGDLARRSGTLSWQTPEGGIVHDQAISDRAIAATGIDTRSSQNTFHSLDYVRREWAKYFEIVDLQSARLQNHQDTVLLRKAP